jgi:hypothetical protein
MARFAAVLAATALLALSATSVQVSGSLSSVCSCLRAVERLQGQNACLCL